ncbi:response regulator containing CheY-like receiver, AAA-type ATPase, and DNA-binding domains [Bellilinea caldifistulae]|jgi:two-component system chemotaxis response regulator CheY|uniref:Chemotaxis protein CheY n=1 Tax=Bellilinea caldifistulae TaxID=360411 RepID=A0A0P6XB71_9CHLR|nr:MULTISPECIES: response regulator [Bellilinea]KPL77508.1 chemotaxis protein CheY [Bellilinea caldifistulae]GAP09716.1 response regulator containing CheY-like receiver, AAA-type ATPase, and DNA-binding domains [Bellilinea caldifistulae]HAD06275.1 response regulator [Anaerolineaceae bacterium]
MTKILIVDDAEFLRVRIIKMLTGQGFEVYEAENGAKAVEKYKEVRPDVVLMDITMPEMDGLAALKEIRAFDSQAKVVMLTALGQESVVLEAVKSGARDFIVKPFEHDRVMSAIHKLAG